MQQKNAKQSEPKRERDPQSTEISLKPGEHLMLFPGFISVYYASVHILKWFST